MIDYESTQQEPPRKLSLTISITSPSFLRACIAFTLLTIVIISTIRQIDAPDYLVNLLALVTGTLFEAMPPPKTATDMSKDEKQ